MRDGKQGPTKRDIKQLTNYGGRLYVDNNNRNRQQHHRHSPSHPQQQHQQYQDIQSQFW